MEWWTSVGGATAGQRAHGGAAAFAGAPAEQTPTGDPDPQLDAGTGIFDPWLNTDDLDIGAILNQANCATVTATTPSPVSGAESTTTSSASSSSSSPSSSSSSSSSSTTSAMDSHSQHLISPQNAMHQYQQQHQSHQTASDRQTATHTRLPADNKRHIISIINKSTSQQQQQQQAANMGLISRHGSIAGSPLSSSLGSSPLNIHTNYSLSPHSSSSPPTQNPNHHNYVETSTNGADVNSGNDNNEVSDTKSFVSIQHVHQQQSACFFSDCYLVEGVEHEGSQTVEDHSDQEQFSDGNNNAYALQSSATGRQEIVHQDNVIVMACPQQHNRTNAKGVVTLTGNRTNCGGSSLLSGPPASSCQRQGTKQNAKQATTKGHNINNNSNNIKSSNKHQTGLNGGQQSQQKTRRCRHITDYVLAEEERRLLIKEGHADFPMTCQSRPLTKNEERILRKIRRKIRNKKSAQCSRQRKKEYVEDLERKYAAVLRENKELRQLLAGGVNDETKFIDQLGIDSPHQEHLSQQQQQMLFEDHHQQVASGQQHQNEIFLHNGQSSNGRQMNQMTWKDLFPQTTTTSIPTRTGWSDVRPVLTLDTCSNAP